MTYLPPTYAADAWTSDRSEGGKNKILDLVTGFRDVGNAKVKDLNKSSMVNISNSRGSARSQKAIQLQSKLMSSKPVPRSNAQLQEVLESREEKKDAAPPGPHFMPSENPTATLLAQITTGSSRLTQSQSEYLESLNQKPGQSNNRIVPSVDVGCGFFQSGAQIEFAKRNILCSESVNKSRTPINLKKSHSMVAPRTNAFRGTRHHPRINGSLSSVSSDSSGASVKSLQEPSRHMNDPLPVYDINELEADNSQVDLVLPGVCQTTSRRPLGRSATILNARTKQSLGISYDVPLDLQMHRERTDNTTLEELVSDVPFDLTKQTCDCQQCHRLDLKSKPPVQYCHGDVIKTFSWLSKDTKETSL